MPCRGAAATEELWFYWTRSLKSVGGGLCLLSHTLSVFTRHHLLLFLGLSCYFWCVFILLLFLLLPLLMWSLCFLSSFLVLSSLSCTLHPSPPTSLALNTALVRRKMEAWTNPSLTQYVKIITRYRFPWQLKIWKPLSDVLTECSVAIRTS